MKKVLSKIAIVALMAISALSFALVFISGTDFSLLFGIISKASLGAVSYGSFLTAKKIYKGNLATGNR